MRNPRTSLWFVSGNWLSNKMSGFDMGNTTLVYAGSVNDTWRVTSDRCILYVMFTCLELWDCLHVAITTNSYLKARKYENFLFSQQHHLQLWFCPLETSLNPEFKIETFW